MKAITKILALITVLLLAFSGLSASAASEIKVFINGKVQTYDQSPIIKNGSTLVPLRGIFESLGAQVSYNDKTKTITGKKDNRVVILVLGSTRATVDGKEVNLTQPAEAVNGRTMVPLRFIGESLGAAVQWDGKNRQVLITSAVKTEAELVNSILVDYEGMWESDSPDPNYFLWVEQSTKPNQIDIELIYLSEDYVEGVLVGTVKLSSPTSGTFEYVREYEDEHIKDGIIQFKNNTITLTYTEWDQEVYTVTFKVYYPVE